LTNRRAARQDRFEYDIPRSFWTLVPLRMDDRSNPYLDASDSSHIERDSRLYSETEESDSTVIDTAKKGFLEFAQKVRTGHDFTDETSLRHYAPQESNVSSLKFEH